MKVIAEFIPIILLLLYLSFSNYFIELTHSTLGKLLMVSIIVFYARINKYLGLLVCLFIIGFYNATNPILFTLRSFQEGVQSRPLSEGELDLEKQKENNRAAEERLKQQTQSEQNKLMAERNKVLDKQSEHNAKCDRAKYVINNKEKFEKQMIDDAKKVYSECMGITVSPETNNVEKGTFMEGKPEENTSDTEFTGFKTFVDGFTDKKEEFTTYSEKNEKEFKLLQGINARK